jgi:hypothetical protein
MTLKTKSGAEISGDDLDAIAEVMNDAVYALASLPASARDATAWRDALMVAHCMSNQTNLRVEAIVAEIINEIAPEPTS